MAKWQRATLWGLRQRKKVQAWVFRGVTFYFGYRILQHEVYETETSEPLLIILGLWLCGIAPATFLDSLRRGAANFQRDLAKAAEEADAVKDAAMPDITKPAPDASSGIEPVTDGNSTGGT